MSNFMFYSDFLYLILGFFFFFSHFLIFVTTLNPLLGFIVLYLIFITIRSTFLILSEY